MRRVDTRGRPPTRRRHPDRPQPRPSTGTLAPVAGAFTSAPGITALLVLVLAVVVVGRVLLSVAWRLVPVALAVSVVLWGLGAVGLTPV